MAYYAVGACSRPLHMSRGPPYERCVTLETQLFVLLCVRELLFRPVRPPCILLNGGWGVASLMREGMRTPRGGHEGRRVYGVGFRV